MNENEQMFYSETSENKTTDTPAEGGKKVYSEEDVETMRRAHKKELTALEDELHDVKVGHALGKLLEASGARNPDFLRRMVKVRDIPLDEHGVPVLSSVETMLDALRKTDAYLFTEPAGTGKGETHPPYRAPAKVDESQLSDEAYYAQRMSRR